MLNSLLRKIFKPLHTLSLPIKFLSTVFTQNYLAAKIFK